MRFGKRFNALCIACALTAAVAPRPVFANDTPGRTVGPQTDGSIVASDNQTLTPAGKMINLGAPVRAKSVALNPNSKTHTGAVLLMGSPQPIIVFDTNTGQVLQRFLPTGLGGGIFRIITNKCSPNSPTDRKSVV